MEKQFFFRVDNIGISTLATWRDATKKSELAYRLAMIKIIALCMVALGIVIVHPGKSCAETAIHQAPNQAASVERRKEGPDGLTVLALLLAALVPTFVVSQLLLLLVGPHLVLAHGASFLITGFAAGTLFTSESGFAGTGALALVAAPQLFWLLVDLIRARSGAERN